MEKEKSKILVKDVLSGSVLLECELNEAERAYAFAAEMDKAGLDVQVIDPTLSETLSDSLGFSADVRNEYMRGLDEEIEGHEDSCCSKKIL